MAFIKSPTSDAIHAVRNCDGSKAAAIFESTNTYSCHAVGNREEGQAKAFVEYFKP